MGYSPRDRKESDITERLHSLHSLYPLRSLGDLEDQCLTPERNRTGRMYYVAQGTLLSALW